MRHVIPMKRANIKIFFVFVSIIVVFNLYFYSFHVPLWKSGNVLVKSPVELQYVVVHIDLKGAPPKLEYLLSLLPMLRYNGVNGLLIEYEDMFPYEGKLANLSAKNSYERSQLKNFIEIALQYGFEVIPLVQTFGHLEYALKLEEFRKLRENLAHPDSICPSNPKSRDMVLQMLEQVVSFHSSISPLKHIHVGCDEVFLINECKQCRKKRLSNDVLFIDYVRYISNVIKNLSPITTVLIWDDMLRKINPLAWRNIDMFDNVEPVCWRYEELTKFPHLNFMKYRKKFKNEWVASAFKGADGRTATIPDLHKRLMNHYSWMTLLQTSKIPGENTVYHSKGIILTGWSRYNHLDPLCELLPVSIPSLILNLRMIKIFKSGGIDANIENIHDFFSNHLFDNNENFSCHQKSRPVPSAKFINQFCYFDGHKLYRLLNIYMLALNNIKTFLLSDEMFAYEYYFQTNYISKNKSGLTEYIEMCSDKLRMIQSIEGEIALTMKQYYEDNVIYEYIAYKSYYVKKKLAHLKQTFRSFLSFNGFWERRPSYTII